MGDTASSMVASAALTSSSVRAAARAAASNTESSSSPRRTGRPRRSLTQPRTPGRTASLTTMNEVADADQRVSRARGQAISTRWPRRSRRRLATTTPSAQAGWTSMPISGSWSSRPTRRGPVGPAGAAPVSDRYTAPRSSAWRARTKSRQVSLAGWPAGGTPRIRPELGFSVATPHSAAGHRSDPVPSEPWATATMPLATAAAGPPLDPPGERARSHGFLVGSNPAGSVVAPMDSCGHAALPTTEYPTCSKASASAVVAAEELPASRKAATPTQCGVPAISWPASFSRMGTPSPGRSKSGATTA